MIAQSPDGTYELHVNSAPIGNTGDSIIRLQVLNIDPSNLALETHVWSLLNLTTTGVAATDALSAIEAALSLIPLETKINFHEQTNLLIVRGTDEALSLTQSTLEALESDATRQNQLRQETSNTISELEFRLAEAEADMRLAVTQLEIARSQQDTTELQFDKAVGFDPDLELVLHDHKLRVAQAERSLFVAQKRREMFQKQLDQFLSNQ